MSGGRNTGELARHAADPIGWRRMKSRLALKLSPEEAGRYFKGFWEGWWRQRLYTDQVRESIGSASPAEWSIQLPDWPNSEVDPLARLARWDRAGSLAGDLLIKTDYATMAYGLEARAPLLDHRLTAGADRLPRHRWATVDQTKVALREIASELLPAELVERPKRGFGLPLKKWLQTDLADWTRELLLDSPVTAGELFEASTIETILDEHTSGHRNHTGRIYTLLVFELWHRCHRPRRARSAAGICDATLLVQSGRTGFRDGPVRRPVSSGRLVKRIAVSRQLGSSGVFRWPAASSS